MLPLQFFEQNLHFAVSLFAALVFFAVFWLYFDAWLAGDHKAKKDMFKWLGFLLVCVSFVIRATVIEQSDLGRSVFGNTSETISTFLRLVGYAGIIIGQLSDPLQKKPDTKDLETELSENPSTAAVPAVSASTSSFGSVYALPLGSLAIAWLYWRRATKGLERHLKPVAIAFLLLFIFELLSLANLAQATDNPAIFNLVKAFGPLWIASYLFLLAGVFVLGRWVWRYLTERFLSQLFMIFTGGILAVFLITTMSFTFLLMRNVKDDSLENLKTAVNVLGYALDAKKAETHADAESVAQSPATAAAVINKDHEELASLNSDFLATKKQSSLVITNSSGQVLLRAEDPERWGDSISSDTSVRRALVGKVSSTIAGRESVLAPQIYIKTTVPLRDGSKNIIGTVTSGLIADNSFTDGIKNSTGLDSAIYIKNTLSATTFLAPDGKTRQIGVKQNDKTVNSLVLNEGKTFKGQLNILNRPYLAVYAPLKDADNRVVGMLFIGKPQASILKTAGRSIELTFLIAVGLLILAIIPAYLMSKYLTRQLD